jgi:hypothetical protein
MASDAGVYGLSGIESAAAPGFTYGTAGAGGTAALALRNRSRAAAGARDRRVGRPERMARSGR